MNDFDYDVLQKKRLARNALAKKNGSRSKKCTLPSDYLTAKQWKERNGEVVTVKMNRPLDWKSFKKLSHSLQVEYLNKQIKEYGCNAQDMAKMFDVNSSTFFSYYYRNGLKANFARGSKGMSKEQRKMWELFLAGEAGTQAPAVEEPAAAEEPVELVTESLVVDEPAAEEPAKIVDGVKGLSQFSLRYSGKVNIMDVLNSVIAIAGGHDINGDIVIEVSV